MKINKFIVFFFLIIFINSCIDTIDDSFEVSVQNKSKDHKIIEDALKDQEKNFKEYNKTYEKGLKLERKNKELIINGKYKIKSKDDIIMLSNDTLSFGFESATEYTVDAIAYNNKTKFIYLESKKCQLTPYLTGKCEIILKEKEGSNITINDTSVKVIVPDWHDPVIDYVVTADGLFNDTFFNSSSGKIQLNTTGGITAGWFIPPIQNTTDIFDSVVINFSDNVGNVEVIKGYNVIEAFNYPVGDITADGGTGVVTSWFGPYEHRSIWVEGVSTTVENGEYKLRTDASQGGGGSEVHLLGINIDTSDFDYASFSNHTHHVIRAVIKVNGTDVPDAVGDTERIGVMTHKSKSINIQTWGFLNADGRGWALLEELVAWRDEDDIFMDGNTEYNMEMIVDGVSVEGFVWKVGDSKPGTANVSGTFASTYQGNPITGFYCRGLTDCIVDDLQICPIDFPDCPANFTFGGLQGSNKDWNLDLEDNFTQVQLKVYLTTSDNEFGAYSINFTNITEAAPVVNCCETNTWDCSVGGTVAGFDAGGNTVIIDDDGRIIVTGDVTNCATDDIRFKRTPNGGTCEVLWQGDKCAN